MPGLRQDLKTALDKLKQLREQDQQFATACPQCDAPVADWNIGQKRFCSRVCWHRETRENIMFMWRRQDLNRPEVQARVNALKEYRRLRPKSRKR